MSCNLLVLVLILLTEFVLAQPGSYYPPPSSINYQTDTLIIYPPDSLPGDPVILIGYNIYVDEDFYGNIMVSDPEVAVNYFLDDESLTPGSRIFCVDAVYNEWISEGACDTAFISYGYELPFYESWSSGSFETLQWTTDSDHWIIDYDEGDPSPSVSFQGEPGLTNYEAVLESYPMNAVGLTVGIIWLDFSLRLENIQSTNNEKLRIQIWNSSNQIWSKAAEFINESGSDDWTQEHIIIGMYSRNTVFKIRFMAMGENSADISSWSIDNIHVYRTCERPTDLEIEENHLYNKLSWTGNTWIVNDWIHWDDGVNSGNSIGTNSEAEFDVAARWITGQLSGFNGFLLDKIAFFPAESQASYNVRVWTGTGPDTLVIDQPVDDPVINAWNYVTLTTPLVFDTNKDLWIGYHVSTSTGWPAGVDDGPAINGYGNMMYYDGTWQTLLEISPDLDYNWNIEGHFYLGPEPVETFYIYRNRNQEEFEFYDITNQLEYSDSNIILSDIYCYKITEIWSSGSDTCESDPSNTACETLWLGSDQPDNKSKIQIYPNPASSHLDIKSPDKINNIKIYNMLGECELKLELGNLEGRVDVSGLGNGIYFVEVVTKEWKYREKVLIYVTR